jgi:2-polyprenyl-3-methyl-5-hydroxy-6-metoxy-1,4-benzoquinol methylase
MDFDDISLWIGRYPVFRRVAYTLLTLTTLREWYIRRALKRIMDRQQKTGFSFLDGGSGIGQHAFLVARRHPEADVTGIELDARRVRDCQQTVQKLRLSHLRFIQGDISTIVLDHKDVILCNSVLEHVQDDQKTLGRFWEILNPGGVLILYVPVSEKRVLPSLRRLQYKKLQQSSTGYLHDHVRYYSVNELREKLETSGFSVESVEHTYGEYGRIAYDIVTRVQYQTGFMFLFPFYLLLVHPLVMMLMWADFKHQNKQGNGLLMIARKPYATPVINGA